MMPRFTSRFRFLSLPELTRGRPHARGGQDFGRRHRFRHGAWGVTILTRLSEHRGNLLRSGSTDSLFSEAYRMLFFLLVVPQLIGSSCNLFAQSCQGVQTESACSSDSHLGRIFVIGFMGGFVHSDDLRHSEAQIADRLQRSYGDRVRVRTFENRHIALAHAWVVDQLDKHVINGSGVHGEERNQGARIILFGHSWGASAVVYLARELERDGIPVLLTIQVDSIAKHGVDDSMIPVSVTEAVNFYQTDGLLHGRRKIIAVDPGRTRILGNIRMTYENEPAECRSYPWYDRFLFKGHTSIECDPYVWSQVDSLIRIHLPEPTDRNQSAGEPHARALNSSSYEASR